MYFSHRTAADGGYGDGVNAVDVVAAMRRSAHVRREGMISLAIVEELSMCWVVERRPPQTIAFYSIALPSSFDSIEWNEE